jgi:hypothetical protein
MAAGVVRLSPAVGTTFLAILDMARYQLLSISARRSGEVGKCLFKRLLG